MSSFFVPIPHSSTLTRRVWIERVKKLRRNMHTVGRYWNYGIIYDSDIPGWERRYPVNVGKGVAVDYTFSHAVRAEQMLSVYKQNVEIVPYLFAQQLAEDYWNWVCEVNIAAAQKNLARHKLMTPTCEFITSGWFTA